MSSEPSAPVFKWGEKKAVDASIAAALASLTPERSASPSLVSSHSNRSPLHVPTSSLTPSSPMRDRSTARSPRRLGGGDESSRGSGRGTIPAMRALSPGLGTSPSPMQRTGSRLGSTVGGAEPFFNRSPDEPPGSKLFAVRPVAPPAVAKEGGVVDDLELAKAKKVELEVELELVASEHAYYEQSSSELQQMLQQLMQEYLVVKREHAQLNSKFQGSAKEREAREERRREHLAWVAKQTPADIDRRICRAQAVVRGHKARKVFARMLKRNKHRNHLVNEVLVTEKTYTESLKRVIKMYKVPLRYACNSHAPIVNETEIERMFGNMEEIWEFHKEWLRKYEERVEQWHTHQRIGALFWDLRDALALYQSYSHTHTLSVRMVERLNKRNVAFLAFAEARKDIVMNLASLLIMPIQRIPRYSLLLRDIIKDTSEEHPDYEDLCIALEHVEALAKGMNRAAKITNNTRKLLDIENMFNGQLWLLDAGDKRKYVQSAEVRIMQNKKMLDDIKLWLFSDSLAIGALKDEYVEGEPEYDLVMRLDLMSINAEAVNDIKDYPYSFALAAKGLKDDLVTIITRREDERRMWLELISKRMKALMSELLSIS
eukprot:TRINITY_DN3540_c0_g5_i1.p1 TRINITY_DN3540_c0_g5~~TRINITY_DN3540_c0_g5_i1.p1  ORF type:complete len:601 (+),score=197.16 TRINITY_DN3540_c0_g5_i1:274-2076(+)